jgi:hypothetical protein
VVDVRPMIYAKAMISMYPFIGCSYEAGCLHYLADDLNMDSLHLACVVYNHISCPRLFLNVRLYQ